MSDGHHHPQARPARRDLHAPLRSALPHARHYVGWTEDLLTRLEAHATGQRARLVAVIWHAGIGFTAVRICEGTRYTERAIKNAGSAVPAIAQPAPPAHGHVPLVNPDQRIHPRHLPQPHRKAVTSWPRTPTYRNNPYLIEGLMVDFHRSKAGIAWRWRTRTGSPGRHAGRIPPARRGHHRPMGRYHPGRPHHGRPGGPALAPVPSSSATWCLISRHRLQRCSTRPGCTPAPDGSPDPLDPPDPRRGTRLRPVPRGVCVDDFDAYKAEIGSACYAREARVIRSKMHSHFVTLDIVRHDPLTPQTSSSPRASSPCPGQHHRPGPGHQLGRHRAHHGHPARPKDKEPA